MLYRIFWIFFSLSLMGSVLAGMILAAKALFKTRFSARWHYYIWILLLVRLIVPFAPEHQLSVFNLLKPAAGIMSPISGFFTGKAGSPIVVPANPASIITVITGSGENSLQPSSSEGNELAPVNPKSTIPFEEIAGSLWLAGIIIMAATVTGANLRFTLRMRNKRQCRDAATLGILDACRTELGIKKQVPLVLDPKTRTPLLFGLTRPRILASEEMLERLSVDEKRYVFLHELMHLKKKDILINWITAIIKCIYWFNPVLWYACLRIKEDCEISCDESVLGHICPQEYKGYGQTILNLVRVHGKLVSLTCSTGVAGRKSCIKRRIGMIAGFKRKTFVWTLIALALTFLVGCSALTGAKNGGLQPPEQNENNQTESNGNTPDTNNNTTGNQTENSATTEQPDNTPAPTPQPSDRIKMYENFTGPGFTVSDPQAEDTIQKIAAGQTVVYDEKGKIIAFSYGEEQFVQFLIDDRTVIKTESEGKVSYSCNASIEELVQKAVDYFIGRLNDKTYTGTYGEGFTWYTAAEELGKLGRPAIPSLIEKLKTTDDYERTLALYALLLATQQANVKTFTGGEYINVNLDFDAANHPAMVKTATDWWEKYKSNF